MSEHYDVIVVGSGPGGATVTREFARAGKRVLLLEKGKEHKNLGTYLGAMTMFDRFGFFKSREGLTMLKTTTLGGATMVYSGSAAIPPPWLKTKYGIDLEGYAEAICRELKVDVLPERFMGEASRSIMEAGNRIGQEW
ncbi:MAG: FAD-binding protein, partial [Syntrophaceae bacterium]|nr:FAD-binding protein [Syntrophaceae bacterium]